MYFLGLTQTDYGCDEAGVDCGCDEIGVDRTSPGRHEICTTSHIHLLLQEYQFDFQYVNKNRNEIEINRMYMHVLLETDDLFGNYGML